MIVWGGAIGFPGPEVTNTGGRYNPGTDTWTATSTTNPPDARDGHTAVWTGSEMIVWGADFLGLAGDTTPSPTVGHPPAPTPRPAAREFHTAVWTGSEMIVWGGTPDNFDLVLRTGGKYNPSTDTWTATNTHAAPDGGEFHTAVWTGSGMIVWGGNSGIYPHGYRLFNTGGRYSPSTDRWTPTSTTNAPEARAGHTAVWTGSEMIIWGGGGTDGVRLNTGGRYCAQSSTPAPTPTPAAAQ